MFFNSGTSIVNLLALPTAKYYLILFIGTKIKERRCFYSLGDFEKVFLESHTISLPYLSRTSPKHNLFNTDQI